MWQWLWSVYQAGLLGQVWGAVWPTLVGGALLIGGLQFLKGEDPIASRRLCKVQLLVLGCTLLIMLWDGYWVLHPSKQEVQWQRGTDDYGLN
ncbi:hypothetical protein [Aeromonas caviae]|uniref:hypothetical protein n=1 Tax=Aeromonas caviae TaxID=648 RepID=UPI003F79A851